MNHEKHERHEKLFSRKSVIKFRGCFLKSIVRWDVGFSSPSIRNACG